MGTIRFHYSINNLDVGIEQLISEIEYGNTFILRTGGESMISLSGGDLKWLDWHYGDDCLDLTVDDDFFCDDNIFDKILTNFVYNLADFGSLTLEQIDFTQSKWKNLVPNREPGLKAAKNIYMGTVIKPYYHTSLPEKVAFISRLADLGFGFVKEDETYLVDSETLAFEALAIHSAVGSKIHYVPNITAHVDDIALIERLLANGIDTMMVNILVAGFNHIKKIVQMFPELKLWGHRVGYSLIERHMSVRAFSQLSLLAGISYLHVGTPSSVQEAIKKNELCQDLKNVTGAFMPIFSKTSPEIIRMIREEIKPPMILLACGYFRNADGTLNWQKVEHWTEVCLNGRS